MDFETWTRSVDSCLQNRKRGIKVADIDPDALEKAFTDGESPVLFAQRTSLPLATRGQSVIHVQRPSQFIAYGVVTVAILTSIWGVLLAIRSHTIEQYSSEPKQYPIEYPIKLSWGDYCPPEAVEAVSEAKEFVRGQALSPSSVNFGDGPPILEISRGLFRFKGEIEAKNDFGTIVSASYVIEASVAKRPMIADGTPQYRVVLQNFQKSGSGHSTVWKDASSDSNDIIEDGQFSQARKAAKKSSKFINQVRSGTAPYAGD